METDPPCRSSNNDQDSLALWSRSLPPANSSMVHLVTRLTLVIKILDLEAKGLCMNEDYLDKILETSQASDRDFSLLDVVGNIRISLRAFLVLPGEKN
ncbi:hypothetical protein Tco_0033116 [Tanacetum coccineum]